MEPAPEKPLTLAALDARRKKYQEKLITTIQLDPVVRITLKGVGYSLEFNNWAIKQIFKDCGFNALHDVLTADLQEDPNVIGSLLLRGLQTHHAEMTQEQVDKLFTSRHFPYILNRLQEAMSLFLPEMEESEEKSSDPQ